MVTSHCVQEEREWKIVEFSRRARHKGKIVEHQKRRQLGATNGGPKSWMYAPNSGKFAVLGNFWEGSTSATKQIGLIKHAKYNTYGPK